VTPAGGWAEHRALALRLAAFAALAALAGAQWMRLVESPPVGRVALAVIALVVGAVALAAIAVARPRRVAASALAAVATVGATAVGLMAIGVPAHLLDPGSWDELGAELGRGFNGLAGDVPYPYDGDNEWARIVLLAGLPVALGLAAVLAFWPRRTERGRRTAPLIVLAATFGVGATVVAPSAPVLWGALLVLAIAAWLWLPSLPARGALAGAAVVAVAGALALPVAGALDGDKPWIDFRKWQLGRDDPASFEWNHSYGPLDWPRDGTTLLAAESAKPQYWKASVLDQFDGTRWRRPELHNGARLEIPPEVERGIAGPSLPRLNEQWIEKFQITIGPLESDLVIGAGAVGPVDGTEDGVLARTDGTLVSDGEPLEEGDSYSFLAYVPDPSPNQLRNASTEYPGDLAPYTRLTLPGRPGQPAIDGAQPGEPTPGQEVQVPLRGSDAGGDRAAARAAFAASPYAETYDLAQRLTRSAPTAYDAAEAIKAHLLDQFSYDENPPDRRYPLAAFLFEDRIGYCQQFSGAMALMLRMAGIPSRVVTGFSPGTPDSDEKNRYLVSDLDAHSWVEAYFPGIGWVTFDPTPGTAPANAQSDDLPPQVGNSSLNTEGQQDNRRKGFNPDRERRGGVDRSSDSGTSLWFVPAGIGLLGLVGAGAGAGAVGVRRLRYRGLSPEAAAEAHLRELVPALERLGWPLKATDTLLSLERRLRNYGKPAAARYVAKLRTNRFSPTHPDAPVAPTLADRRALRDELASRNGLGSRLRGLRAIPPGGPRA
jgi:protein-glutamine gamma-glutamyltransferase